VLCEVRINYVSCRDRPDAITFSSYLTEMHETTCFVLQASLSSVTRRVTCSASFVLITCSAEIGQFSLYHFSYPDSLLHYFPIGVAPDASCRFDAVAWNEASLLSVTRRVTCSVRFVLITCRAGIGQTPSYSLLTSQRCMRKPALFYR